MRINRNNIANIQLDKRGQAVQVQLKSAVEKKRAPSQENNRSQARGSVVDTRQVFSISDFLPKVGSVTSGKSKEKMNITHYYTQTQKQLKTNGGPGGKPGTMSNGSSVEAIA